MQIAKYVWQPLIRVFFATALLLLASGMWLMARLAKGDDALRRGWRAAFSLVVAALLLAGVAGMLLGERGAYHVARGPGMMLLFPFWAFWLARILGRLSTQAQARQS